MSFLVDANVLSEATKPHPDARVTAWLTEHDDELHVSVLTLGELRRGISLCPQSRKRAALDVWLRNLMLAFSDRILPVDQTVALAWGEYYAKLQHLGRKPPTIDSLLAATARVHNLTVASRNVDDFSSVPVVNPWDAS